MFHLLSLVEKWQSHYEKNSKNDYYQKNYFIFKLPYFTEIVVKNPTWKSQNLHNPVFFSALSEIEVIFHKKLHFELFLKKVKNSLFSNLKKKAFNASRKNFLSVFLCNWTQLT